MQARDNIYKILYLVNLSKIIREIWPERPGHPDRVATVMLAQGRALRRRHNLIDAGRTTPSAHIVDRVTQSKLITCTHKIVQARNNN